MLVPLEEYEGYKINKSGDVYSFKRYKEGRKLGRFVDKDGYYYTSLMKNGKGIKEKLHRLLAKTFIKNESNLPQVNHINGIKKDIRLENLEWVSNLDNQRHAWDMDLKTVKLKVSDVINIKKRILLGESNKEICEDFDVDRSSISNIRTGKTWKRVEVKDDK